MKTKWLVILLLSVLIFFAAACAEKEPMEVTSVVHTSQSGTILPELQWHEEIRITTDKAAFTRKGMTPDTQVNAGTWEVSLDEGGVKRLFEQLGTVDCSRLKRNEMENPPIGGGSESYSLIYSDEKSCSLYFDPGMTITGSEAVVEPVDVFIRGIEFPPDSIPQHNPPQ